MLIASAAGMPRSGPRGIGRRRWWRNIAGSGWIRSPESASSPRRKMPWTRLLPRLGMRRKTTGAKWPGWNGIASEPGRQCSGRRRWSRRTAGAPGMRRAPRWRRLAPRSKPGIPAMTWPNAAIITRGPNPTPSAPRMLCRRRCPPALREVSAETAATAAGTWAACYSACSSAR